MLKDNMQKDTYIPKQGIRPKCRFSHQQVEYLDALAQMETQITAIRDNTASEQLWFLEHPPLYTAGTSANPKDLIEDPKFPVYQAGRGGQYTYHGTGQRIVYVMLDLKKHGTDIRHFVHRLEEWVIRSLSHFNIDAHRHKEHIGIWVGNHKIAAIGIRVRKWVSFHGIAINLDPDLSHFKTINPCGVPQSEAGVTSMMALGITATMEELDMALLDEFAKVFNGNKN